MQTYLPGKVHIRIHLPVDIPLYPLYCNGLFDFVIRPSQEPSLYVLVLLPVRHMIQSSYNKTKQRRTSAKMSHHSLVGNIQAGGGYVGVVQSREKSVAIRQRVDEMSKTVGFQGIDQSRKRNTPYEDTYKKQEKDKTSTLLKIK